MKRLPKEYLMLFNAITDADKLLADLRERLAAAQSAAEELYIDGEGEQE